MRRGGRAAAVGSVPFAPKVTAFGATGPDVGASRAHLNGARRSVHGGWSGAPIESGESCRFATLWLTCAQRAADTLSCMLLTDAISVLRLAGYQLARVVGELRVDRAEAEAMSCDACGTLGMRYTALRRGDERPHRALAWCPECSHAVEL